jgi:hypothetical protein
MLTEESIGVNYVPRSDGIRICPGAVTLMGTSHRGSTGSPDSGAATLLSK